MRDGLITLPSLGQAAGTTVIKKCNFPCVVDVFILLRFSPPVNPPNGNPHMGTVLQQTIIISKKNPPLNNYSP